MTGKSVIYLFLGSIMCVLFSAAPLTAQQTRTTNISDIKDKYQISAKAGGVNFVEGNVIVKRADGTTGILAKGDQLEAGDTVMTGELGKAEILLNPGSYTRLGGKTSFRFKTTSLDNLEIELKSGSANFEVFASKDFRVTINTPKTKLFLIQTGIYRLDVSPDGIGKIAVYQGQAQLADSASTIVKKGRSVTLGSENALVAKVDSDDKDQLDAWSKTRAKELARISRKVDQASMRTALLSSFQARRWNMYNSFGVWAYQAGLGYSFLPFGWGWNSPFGYGFGGCIFTYNLPPVIYWPPVNNGGGNNGGGPTGPINTPIAQNPRNDGGPRQPPLGGGGGAPPFMQIQRDTKSGLDISTPSGLGGGGRGITDTRSPDVRSGGGDSAPVRSMPAPSMPPPSPGPSRSDVFKKP